MHHNTSRPIGTRTIVALEESVQIIVELLFIISVLQLPAQSISVEIRHQAFALPIAWKKAGRKNFSCPSNIGYIALKMCKFSVLMTNNACNTLRKARNAVQIIRGDAQTRILICNSVQPRSPNSQMTSMNQIYAAIFRSRSILDNVRPLFQVVQSIKCDKSLILQLLRPRSLYFAARARLEDCFLHSVFLRKDCQYCQQYSVTSFCQGDEQMCYQRQYEEAIELFDFSPRRSDLDWHRITRPREPIHLSNK
jgi:hypothetical protein